MRIRASVRLVACGVLVFVLGGCGGGDAAPPSGQPGKDGPGSTQTGAEKPSTPPPGAGAASCILMVVYESHAYYGAGVEVAPREGRFVGAGILPGCNDTGGEPAPDEEIELAEIEGVSPGIALAWQGRTDVVLVREGFDDRLPPEVRRLMQAPSCDIRDEPIQLAGPWIGILGPDETGDLDLASPYDVELFVEKSSVPRYERAFLTVRVRAGPERPLTRADIRSSLWEGGTIELGVVCQDGRYVAESATAYPPG